MKKISNPLKVLIISAFVILGTQYALAWNPPPQIPPSGNVPAPINVGPSSQLKSGALTVGGIRSLTDGYFDGNVGIGTVSPTQKLDIIGRIRIFDGTQAVNKVLASDANGVGSWRTLNDLCATTGACGGGGTTTLGGSGITNYVTKWLNNTTLGNSTMYDNGTAVGIGTTVPYSPLSFGNSLLSSGKKLALYESSTGTLIYGFGISNGSLDVYTNGAQVMAIKSGGNVGIGTTSPTQKLDVNGIIAIQGKTAIEGSDPYLRINQNNAFTSGVHVASKFNAFGGFTTGNYFTANPGIGNALIEGNVGIGTTNPTQKLDIDGQIRIRQGAPAANKILASDTTGVGSWRTIDDICASSPGACGGGGGGGVGGSGTLNYVAKWTPNGTTLGNSSIFDNGTNVGIGDVSPTYKLDVSGTLRATGRIWTGAGAGGGVWLDGSSETQFIGAQTSTAIGIYNNGAYRFTINELGNVGIPTVSGSYKLNVTGNIGAQGFFYTSDQSLKKNISELQGSLSKILQLKGVSFNWKEDGRADVGLIAQDVEKVYPELVNTDKSTGLKSVEYGNLVAPLIEAIKEQQKQIDELKAQVKELQNKK